MHLGGSCPGLLPGRGTVFSFLCLDWPGFSAPPQANIGQVEDFEEARKKALKLGAKKVLWEAGLGASSDTAGRGSPWARVPCLLHPFQLLLLLPRV